MQVVVLEWLVGQCASGRVGVTVWSVCKWSCWSGWLVSVQVPGPLQNFGLRSIGADVPRNRVHRTFSQADYEAAIDQLNDPSTKQVFLSLSLCAYARTRSRLCVYMYICMLECLRASALVCVCVCV